MNIQPGAIDFDHQGIGSALSQNRRSVPLNQREYSWEKEHILDLFHDLAEAIDSGKPAYFLGTIVLARGNDAAWEVVDGQQRLATTTILLAAIRDYFKEQSDDLLVRSLNDFLFTIVRETRELYPRLKLNVDDNAFFRSRILEEEGTPSRASVNPQRSSHQRITLAAELAKQHVQKIIAAPSGQSRIDQLNRWVSFIEKAALVILLRVPDDLNAYVMFETLNDRGLKTSQSDLVKNYLFAQADDRLKEAQQKWANMDGAVESLDQDDIVINYLRHFVISRYGHTRERDVLQRVKEKVVGGTRAIEFLSELADGANDYAALLTPTHTKWNAYSPSIREHIRTMAFLQMTPLRPVMLSVLSKFTRPQVERAFRLFVFWSVRFLIAGGGRSGAVEEAFARAAQKISEGGINSAGKLTQELTDVLPSDVEFESAFATARVSRNAHARYYLRALELKTQGNQEPEWIPNEDVVINLEHVLPEHPDSSWASFDNSLAPAYFKRLGNMVLLQASINDSIGNKSFSTKTSAFQKSNFALTKEVAKNTVWEPAKIDERQKKLARLAVGTWPLKTTRQVSVCCTSRHDHQPLG